MSELEAQLLRIMQRQGIRRGTEHPAELAAGAPLLHHVTDEEIEEAERDERPARRT